MPWTLREHLHWCDCGGRAVFLDLEADRYFCLPGETNAAFLRTACGSPQAEDLEALDPLVRRGLLVEGDGQRAIPTPAAIVVPESDFPGDADPRARLPDIISAICSELRTAWLLRRRGLRRAIENVGRPSPTIDCLPPDACRSMRALVAAAGWAALFLKSHDRCLVRGLAFQASCRKRGLKTKLVIGVIAHPFTAHCWVQADRIVLVGGYEQARLYTPILVLE